MPRTSNPLSANLNPATKPVLVVLGTNAGWCRGILKGFMDFAHERPWLLAHYPQFTDLSWLAEEWAPSIAVIGPEPGSDDLAALAPAPLISVTIDRCAAGIASVVPDEAAIAVLAAEHLLGKGLRRVSTVRFDDMPFAVQRERFFVEHARSLGARISSGLASVRKEDPGGIIEWLRRLPKPCGVFTITDAWARIIARYARLIGLRIPEDIALVGVDNDELECELISPPLSSVAIPWQEIGRTAAMLVEEALLGRSIRERLLVVQPTGVVARRSSDTLAVADDLVADAVRWIHAHVERRLTVPMVARALGGGRQRLERRFRASLNRTVQEEIRRVRVERARQLLETTRSSLTDIAKSSGFGTAGRMNAAFHRELHMAPGSYRRLVQQERGSRRARKRI